MITEKKQFLPSSTLNSVTDARNHEGNPEQHAKLKKDKRYDT